MRFRFAVLVLTLVFAFPVKAAQKPEIESVRCPDTYKGETFSGFEIFEGPLDAKEYLLSDDDGWDIESSRKDGNKIYLACRYGDADTRLQIEFPLNIDFCTPAEFNVDCH